MVATPSAPLLNHRNDTQSTLAVAITSGGQTTITVAAGDGATKFASLPADLLVTYGGTAEEMVATDRTGDVLTVTRSVGGGTLTSAPIGTPVERIVGSETFTRLNAALRRSPIVSLSVDQAATGGDGTYANPWTGWETAVNALPGYVAGVSMGADVHYPAGEYLQTTRIDVKKGQTHRGAGSSATRIRNNFTGDAFRTGSTIDVTNIVETLIVDLTVVCLNLANTGGGIVDVAGSFVRVLRVGVENFKYGIIFDQTEVATIQDCQISGMRPNGACIWLCSTNDHTPAATLFNLTNRIGLFGNQLNGGSESGVICLQDDGGTCHIVHGNNFNAGAKSVRLTGTTVASFTGNEMEGASAYPVEMSNLSPAGTSLGQGPTNIAFDNNLIVVGNQTASVFNFLSAGYVAIANNALAAGTGQPILKGCVQANTLHLRNNQISGGNALVDTDPTNGFFVGDTFSTGSGVIVGGVAETHLGGATKGLALRNGSAPTGNPVGGTVLYATAGQVLERTSGGAFQGMVPTTLSSWAPGSITQNGNVTFTTNSARYLQIGKLAIVFANLAITGTGTTNNKITLNLPAGLTSAALGGGNPQVVGTFRYFDSGTASYVGAVLLESTSNLVFQRDNVTAYVGIAPNIAAANGDTLEFSAQWELA